MPLAELANLRARSARVDPPPSPRLASKQYILPYGQPLDELEVLMDETDRTVTFDGAFVGTQRSERDVCKRRLAGSVFADQCVNGARLEIEIDTRYRDNVTKPFDDAAQRKG